MLLYQVIITVGLTACFANLVLNLLALKTPRRTAPLPSPAPKLSVMIPARNEAANIRLLPHRPHHRRSLPEVLRYIDGPCCARN